MAVREKYELYANVIRLGKRNKQAKPPRNLAPGARPIMHRGRPKPIAMGLTWANTANRQGFNPSMNPT